MPLSIFKRNPRGKEIIDIEEAYNIWMLLTTRYDNVQTIQVLRNFIHDRDLAIIVNQIADEYQKQIQNLENEAKYFELKVPEKPPKDVRTSQSVDAFSDQFIYNIILGSVKDDLFILSRTVRTSTTNDRLRGIFKSLLASQLSRFELTQKYGKLKEWLEPAPTYKTAKAVQREKLEIGEAFHLWDHVSLRYDQIQLTEFFASFAHDTEYRTLLQMGLKLLNNQAGRIEKVMLDLEIPLPKRPPVSVKTPTDPETLEDVFTYRTLLRGIQEALDLHLRAVVESVRNDALRQLFTKFILEEIDVYDPVS